jgi:cytochrome c oxidase subunit II
VQIKAFDLFVAINVLVVAVFVWVVLSTRHQREPVARSVNRLRAWFFGILTGGLVLALVLMFPRMPYPKGSQKPDRIVYAVGMQFSWGISNQPIKNPDEWREMTYAPPVKIPVGSLVEFRVTSFDVNHSFAVFTPSGHLMGQVQAMPGYVNHLRLRFTKPGTYWVFCLELCGMGHHRMRGEFEVVPRASSTASTSAITRESHGGS